MQSVRRLDLRHVLRSGWGHEQREGGRPVEAASNQAKVIVYASMAGEKLVGRADIGRRSSFPSSWYRYREARNRIEAASTLSDWDR